MPYARPTLTSLRQIAYQDLASADLPGVDGFLRWAVLSVLSWGIAGMAYLHYGYQDWVARMAVPWSALDEFAAGWGALKGVTRKAATYAQLTIQTTGGVSGTDVPAGTAVNLRNNTAYTTTADATVASNGIATLAIQASVAGTSGNAAVGTAVTLTNGIAGVGSSGTVTAVVTTAADIETQAAFKARYLQTFANPPAGGDQTDYVEWAEDVPSVTRAWCNPNGNGPGTVVVYPMLDDAEVAHGGFPQGSNGVATAETRDAPASGDQLTVANYIYPLRPVTALVYVVAPLAQPINFTIADLSPNTGTILAAIEVALTGLFLRIGTPLGMTVYPSDWNAAIDSVAGIVRYAITAPSGPVTVPVGSLPTLGTVTSV